MIDAEGVRRVHDAVGVGGNGIERPRPEPLRRALSPALPYPIDALGRILGATARALHEGVQAPLALCGQSVLAAASLATQAHANVEVDGRSIPLSLWALSIAESGERKTAVDRIALGPHIEHERAQIARLDVERRAYEIALEAHRAAVARAKRRDRSATPKTIADAIAGCGPEPTAPPSGIMIVREPTIEALLNIYRTGVGSLGLLSDEGAVWLGGHSMSREHVVRTIATLTALWDRGIADRVRIGDGATKIFDRRLAMHLMVQPVIAERVLSDSLLCNQGFLARALITWPETTAGTRTYREVDPLATPALRAYRARMNALLERPPREHSGGRGALNPRALDIRPEAKRAWIAAHDVIERAMAPGASYSSIRPWASKGAEQIIRVAGVLTLVDNPLRVITLRAIEAATELVRYHLGEAVRLVGTAAVPAAIRNAEAVLKWCFERRQNLVDSRTLLRLGPNCVRDVRTLNGAMAELERAGWAQLRTDARVDDQNVRRAWEVRLDVDA